jgi:hypothetical protein
MGAHNNSTTEVYDCCRPTEQETFPYFAPSMVEHKKIECVVVFFSLWRVFLFFFPLRKTSKTVAD